MASVKREEGRCPLNIDHLLRDHVWDLIPRHEMREAVITSRVGRGCKPQMAKLLTWPDDQAKFKKTNVPIVGVSMLPHRMADAGINLCSHSTHECRKYCLNYTGKGGLASAQRGRAWKTDLLINEPNAWFTMLWHELDLALERLGKGVRCRLNVFTDVAWEDHLPPEFWANFSNVLFMDYTKQWTRDRKYLNYVLVYSASENTTNAAIETKLFAGRSVTVVFRHPKGEPFPDTYRSWPLVDGDTDDDLWSRPKGVIIGLRAKGALARSDSPFARELEA